MAVLGDSSQKTVIGDVAAAFVGSRFRPARPQALQPGGNDPN